MPNLDCLYVHFVDDVKVRHVCVVEDLRLQIVWVLSFRLYLLADLNRRTVLVLRVEDTIIGVKFQKTIRVQRVSH